MRDVEVQDDESEKDGEDSDSDETKDPSLAENEENSEGEGEGENGDEVEDGNDGVEASGDDGEGENNGVVGSESGGDDEAAITLEDNGVPDDVEVSLFDNSNEGPCVLLVKVLEEDFELRARPRFVRAKNNTTSTAPDDANSSHDDMNVDGSAPTSPLSDPDTNDEQTGTDSPSGSKSSHTEPPMMNVVCSQTSNSLSGLLQATPTGSYFYDLIRTLKVRLVVSIRQTGTEYTPLLTPLVKATVLYMQENVTRHWPRTWMQEHRARVSAWQWVRPATQMGNPSNATGQPVSRFVPCGKLMSLRVERRPWVDEARRFTFAKQLSDRVRWVIRHRLRDKEVWTVHLQCLVRRRIARKSVELLRRQWKLAPRLQAFLRGR